ncbi:GntR family transcriptional regulator [Sporanaerobacter acetigenes]|uniref:GntR family transcriptional regulator n=1 Tax=Sporanaerobacter acetigenes TaxID=165813 RepID=UPI0033347444
MGLKFFQSLGDQVFETLKEKIINNEYKPGELMQIDKLASEFGVSTTPIREALLRLDAMGLVSIERNKGAVVTQISKKLAQYTWEFRRLLEAHTSRDTAKHCSEMEVFEIETILNKVLENPNDFEAYKKSDIAIHTLLSKYTENYLIINSLNNLSINARRIRYFAEEGPFLKEVIIAVTHEHLSIIQALKTHNPDIVEEKVKSHLINAQSRTMESSYLE